MHTESARVVGLPETAVYQQQFTVRYDYPVYFTDGVFDRDNPLFEQVLRRFEPAKRHRFVVFVDANVAASWPALGYDIGAYARLHDAALELVAEPELVPAGEQSKNDPALVARLQRRMADLAIDRHSYVVGIGGGAVLDLVGYVAATSHRGVRHVRVPTTVLAQNDAGIGVKNGVNAFGRKNFLGCFAPPHAVLNDARFLRTLHPRDRIAGIAEAVKVALIRDRVFFEWLEASTAALHEFEPVATARMIRRCAELHLRQIGQGGDAFESGSARPLDYGHWSAHRLEALSAHELRHGEAVAIGVALDTRYSVDAGMLEPGADDRVHGVLKKIGFHLWHPALEARDGSGRLRVLDGLAEFREHIGGELSITLLADLGRGEDVHEIDEGRVARAIAWLRRKEIGQ